MLPSEYVKQGWCKDSFARDNLGRKIASTSDDACQWDIFGALEASVKSGTIDRPIRDRLEIVLREGLKPELLSKWNDQQESVAPVLRMLEIAESILYVTE